MTQEFKIPKKLIEVALPLDAINAASAKEKSIRHGHPSTLHLWWARRPLASARAVIFSQMVNDPGYERSLGRGVNKEKARIERERLFQIIEKLVLWENTNNGDVLREAREEIWKSWRETCALNKDHAQAKELFNPDELPAFHDPFAGGGALPLEGQRLIQKSYASDLNPIAVLINRATIEIPPRFRNRNPIGPVHSKANQREFNVESTDVHGLAEDIRRYAAWMRAEAQRRIGHLYPSILITKEIAKNRSDLGQLVGKEFQVIAWLWVRTVRSPSPAFSSIHVPLSSTFVLSSKADRGAYICPELNGNTYRLNIKLGSTDDPNIVNGTKLARGANFKCILSGMPIDADYIKAEGQSKRLGVKLAAMVIEGPSGRLYLPATKEMEEAANSAAPPWVPDAELPNDPRSFWTPSYGLTHYADLFTKRQMMTLHTFAQLTQEVRRQAKIDAVNAGWEDDEISLRDGGSKATAYAEAVSLYLAFAVSKAADRNSALCFWEHPMDRLRGTFGRQTLPMVWDFAETNPLAGAGGDIYGTAVSLAEVLDKLSGDGFGVAVQADAQTQSISAGKVVSTDPPYYDNIGYSDLSDFFYVWLKRSLHDVYPELFIEPTTPKKEELVANPYRHPGKSAAELFFMEGMTKAMHRLNEIAHPAFPVTIFYAFKQSETKNSQTTSTGWETFLDAVLKAGFAISGTWPMRTELTVALKKKSNTLASSIVLVCKKRLEDAPAISRREFVRELNSVLPEALAEMTTGADHSPVAPVDLSQAIIGPGMAIFSKYSAVLEADGKPMSVKAALGLINRFLAEDDFDHDTQFCLQWFEQNGWTPGKYGDADVLARAKGTSVDGLRDGGVVESSSGTLRLLKPVELSISWKPESDSRISIWELLHQMIARFYSGGEGSAGELLAKANNYSENMRTLAYRLYTTCERKGWAQDANSYDGLVRAWDSIESSARAVGYSGAQIALFDATSSANESQIPMTAKSRKKK